MIKKIEKINLELKLIIKSNMETFVNSAKKWYTRNDETIIDIIGIKKSHITKRGEEVSVIVVSLFIPFDASDDRYNRTFEATFTVGGEKQILVGLVDTSEATWKQFDKFINKYLVDTITNISGFLSDMNELLLDQTSKKNIDKYQWKGPPLVHGSKKSLKYINDKFFNNDIQESQNTFVKKHIDDDDAFSTIKPSNGFTVRDNEQQSRSAFDGFDSAPVQQQTQTRNHDLWGLGLGDEKPTNGFTINDRRDDFGQSSQTKPRAYDDTNYDMLIKEKEQLMQRNGLDNKFTVESTNNNVLDDWMPKLVVKFPQPKFEYNDGNVNASLQALWYSNVPPFTDGIRNYQLLCSDIKLLMMIPGVNIKLNQNDLREFELELTPAFYKTKNYPKFNLQFQVVNFTRYYGHISSLFIPRFYHKSLIPMVFAFDSQKSLCEQIIELSNKLNTINLTEVQEVNINTMSLYYAFYYNYKWITINNTKKFIDTDAFRNILKIFTKLVQNHSPEDIVKYGSVFGINNFIKLVIESDYNFRDMRSSDFNQIFHVLTVFLNIFNKVPNDLQNSDNLSKLLSYVKIN